MKTRPVIELRVRYGKSVIVLADSDRLFYIAKYAGYSQSGDGFITLIDGFTSDPNIKIEIRPYLEICDNRYRAWLRKLRRKLSAEKSKTD